MTRKGAAETPEEPAAAAARRPAVPRKRTAAPRPAKPTWEGRLTAEVIGPQIAHWRLRHGMTADELVSTMGALGHPMKRSVLSAIEAGRRDGVSVAEVLIIAQALRVPPIALMIPLGRADSVEIRAPRGNGLRVPTVDVYQWFIGEGPLSSDPMDALSDAAFSVSWVREHEAAVGRLRGRRRELIHAEDRLAWAIEDGAPEGETTVLQADVTRARARLQEVRSALRHYRRAITDYGDIPPTLDEDLAELVDSESWGIPGLPPPSERVASADDRDAVNAALRKLRGEER